MTKRVTFESISCNSTTDPNKHDEVCICVQADQGAMIRYPTAARSSLSIAKDETVTVGDDLPAPFAVDFEENVTVALYEVDQKDLVFTNDYLCNLIIYADGSWEGSRQDENDPDSWLTQGKSAEYKVQFTVTNA